MGEKKSTLSPHSKEARISVEGNVEIRDNRKKHLQKCSINCRDKSGKGLTLTLAKKGARNENNTKRNEDQVGTAPYIGEKRQVDRLTAEGKNTLTRSWRSKEAQNGPPIMRKSRERRNTKEWGHKGREHCGRKKKKKVRSTKETIVEQYCLTTLFSLNKKKTNKQKQTGGSRGLRRMAEAKKGSSIIPQRRVGS